MKTFFANLPKILATILGLVLAVFIVVAIVNSLFLFKFENQFEMGENIKGTDCRDTISACGDLTGTDDFMYMAAALVEVRADTKGVDEKKIKASGCSGVIRPGKTSVQVVIGPKVQFVYDEFKKIAE